MEETSQLPPADIPASPWGLPEKARAGNPEVVMTQGACPFLPLSCHQPRNTIILMVVFVCATMRIASGSLHFALEFAGATSAAQMAAGPLLLPLGDGEVISLDPHLRHSSPGPLLGERGASSSRKRPPLFCFNYEN